MKKRRLNLYYILVAALFCAGLVVAYKAYGIYGDIRTQLDIIEENTRNNGYGNENVLENIYTLQSKAGADVGWYEFDYSWIDEKTFIAHALGGVDGHDYTNSMEALERAYDEGFRVFEGDFQLLDGRVVLMHDMGSFSDFTGLAQEDISYESFMQARILESYTPIDVSYIVRFLSEHPDAWFMTDSKYVDNPYSANVISAFVVAAIEYDESVLDRVIVQIYNQNMLESVMDIYPFRSVVYTLYASADTNEEAISFCLRTGVGAITGPAVRMDDVFVSKLQNTGIKALAHTVNDVSYAAECFDTGVMGIYTDFILPEQFPYD